MPRVTRRLSSGGWSEFDVALAVALDVVAEAELRLSHNVFTGTRSIAADSLLVLVPPVALIWRRSHPFAAVVAVAGAVMVVGAGFHGTVLLFGGLLPFLVAVYSASALCAHPAGSDRAGAAGSADRPDAVIHRHVPGSERLPVRHGRVAISWLAGQAVRSWRRQSIQLAEALAGLEAGRDAQTRLAVAKERVNIARELHDVIAHSLSVMVLQASVARLEAEERSATATRDAMRTIETTGRRALAEMRRLLGVLRSEDMPALGPQPGLAALPELVDSFGRAGLVVEVRRTGEARTLLAGQDVTVFRIVQEALTNALKHGEAAQATLAVEFDSGQLLLRVTNPLRCDRARSDLSGGHGLVRIRERAVLFGGSCRAGCDGEGNFVTTVTLPVESAL